MVTPVADLPIGVFDSGIGGLTVLRALQAHLPRESFIYLGDTARLPYGTKSAETVRRYALNAAAHLVARGIKALVVACNTASATALDQLQSAFRPLPVIGVIEPGALAAARVARQGSVAVIATEATVRDGAYQRALLRQGVRQVFARPAPLLVTLAEEGREHGDLVRRIVADYVLDIATMSRADVLLMGCTHFPVFRAVCQELLGADAMIVDSATTTAASVASQVSPASAADGRTTYLATDGVDRFRRVGSFFLGRTIDTVELVDLV